jgi:hypothetical protein
VPNESKIRIQLDLPPREVLALDALKARCNLASRAAAVRTALAVMEWIEQEVSEGRRVLAVGSDCVNYIVVPGLTTQQDVALPQAGRSSHA